MCIQTMSIKHPDAENAPPKPTPAPRTERQLREAARVLEAERKHRDCPCGYLEH